MSDITIDGALVALGALLTSLAGGAVFVGMFRDDTSLQTKLMTKKKIDSVEAVKKVNSRRQWSRGAFVVLWVASVIIDVVALIATVKS